MPEENALLLASSAVEAGSALRGPAVAHGVDAAAPTAVGAPHSNV